MITKSSRETIDWAASFAQKLKGGEVLCLYGDLGSGKTTFVQGLAEGLGVKGRVISPTFILMREYKLPRAIKGVEHLYHLDLYRIDTLDEVKSLGFEEIWGKIGNIVVIEWAEKIKKILPKARVDIFFQYRNENIRQIQTRVR